MFASAAAVVAIVHRLLFSFGTFFPELLSARLFQAGTSAEGTTAGANNALDPMELILEASTTVQAVMVILVLMGVICLFISGAKLVRLIQATSSSRKFLNRFWEGDANWSNERLESLYAQVGSFDASPIATVFRAGYVELARVMGNGRVQAGDIHNVERALERTSASEMTSLETLLPFLATTGSTAPFIGLFGTVWGIMNSFLNITQQDSVGLDVVAPGIAEALIATAIGLVAAIPAVMAYNFFVRRIQVLESELQAFEKDFLNIARRHFLTA